jgi:hypothetical protein
MNADLESSDVFKEHESTNWTCYSAGEATPEWVMQAAENASTPIDILAMLAESCNVEVRIAVADNQSTSTDTMMMLAQDESADLRYQLAENHNIDESVLQLLADDSHPYVAYRAQKTLKRIRLQDGATIFAFPVLAVVPASTEDLGRKLKRMLF